MSYNNMIYLPDMRKIDRGGMQFSVNNEGYPASNPGYIYNNSLFSRKELENVEKELRGSVTRLDRRAERSSRFAAGSAALTVLGVALINYAIANAVTGELPVHPIVDIFGPEQAFYQSFLHIPQLAFIAVSVTPMIYPTVGFTVDHYVSKAQKSRKADQLKLVEEEVASRRREEERQEELRKLAAASSASK